jgi:DNA mismatch repair protein MutS2
MPQIDNRRLYFRDAYHPILYDKQTEKEITHPQTIELQTENRLL